MKVENQPVWLEHQKGHIKLFGAEVYEERKQRAAQNRAEKLEGVREEGAAVRRDVCTSRSCCPKRWSIWRCEPDGIYIDVTAGLGGHTGAIAERLTTGRGLSLDRDAESMEMARAELWASWRADRVSASAIFGVAAAAAAERE